MKLFDILLEAEAPGTKRETISVKADPNENTNYTDDVPDDAGDDAGSNTQSQQTSTTDNKDDNQEDTTSNEDDNTEDDTDNEEDSGTTEEVGADDSTDYTEDLDDSESTEDDTSDDSDSSYDDSSLEEPAEDPAELKKKKSLLDDLIFLYKDICTNIDKFENLTDIEMNQRLIIIRVKKNFTKISESLYSYITTVFAKDTYVHGLLMYNYYIEMYKINIEMLSKISTFGSNA